MASCATIRTTENATVGMGQIALAQAPARLTAVLGSCIGVALHCRRLQLGALAHVVLPASHGHVTAPGKFADTAILHMLELFRKENAHPGDIIAKMAGGACMFGAEGPMQIGRDNLAAISQLLADAGIRIAKQDTGGTAGRRITFDCGTGQLIVATVGNPPQVF